MSEWRIVQWSKELGRGVIESPHYKNVRFDAARADVDDFSIGEVVCIEGEFKGSDVQVKRIWPDIPRFKRPADAAAPALHQELADGAIHLLSATRRLDYRVSHLSRELLILEGSNDFAYGADVKLELHEPSYVELPMLLSPDDVHLSTPAERAYLATRVDITAVDIALTFVEKPDKFYFAVGAALSRGAAAKGGGSREALDALASHVPLPSL